MTYYQVVFTLPGMLSKLALTNRESMADLLFESAAKSLHKTIRSEQDYVPASMMVLHTWNQQLEPHWHVHALVPGGGPSRSSDQWKTAQAPPDAFNSDDHYLVDAISLRETFRQFAISHLKRLYAAGKLKLGGQLLYLQDRSAWKVFCTELLEQDWVSFIQPPPTKSSTADQVVRYLTRYLTGGPISDSRILAADANNVTFLARAGTRVGGAREQVPVTLPTLEFVRRWCEHIQPEQLTKTRYFGGWCSRNRTEYQARCRDLLGQASKIQGSQVQDLSPSTDLSVPQKQSSDATDMTLDLLCHSCGSDRLRFIGSTPKPSWSSILTHLDTRCPSWYAEADYQDHCEYLAGEYGISYADWALEMGIESTMSDPLPPEPKYQQQYLPGLYPQREFWLESY